MMRALIALIAGIAMTTTLAGNAQSILHVARSSSGDLEVGGELAGLRAGATRYIRYEDLLRLPQESFTVSDDSNFGKKTEIEGVALDGLARMLAGSQDGLMFVAICYDKYRTNYPHVYIAEHHPLLVLRINGKLREHWPPSENGGSMRPYLVSHPFFKPAFKVLSHEDEAQIPYGVTRIEVRNEATVFGAIRPHGKWAAGSPVEQGYAIARQDCFRCHNMNAEGGTLAGRSWMKLSAMADHDGKRFRQIIRNPAAINPDAKMPAHSDYDDATLNALTAYFKTFSAARRPQ